MGPLATLGVEPRAEEPADLVAMLRPDGFAEAAWGPLLAKLGIGHAASGLGPLLGYVHPDDVETASLALDRAAPGNAVTGISTRIRDLTLGWRRCEMTLVVAPASMTRIVSLRAGPIDSDRFARVVDRLARSVEEEPTGPTADRADAVLLNLLPTLAAALDADAVWAGLLYTGDQMRWELQRWDDRAGHNPFVNRVETFRIDHPVAHRLMTESGASYRPDATDDDAQMRRHHDDGLRLCHESVAPLNDLALLSLGVGSSTPGVWERRPHEIDAAIRLAVAIGSADIAHGFVGVSPVAGRQLGTDVRLAPERLGLVLTGTTQVLWATPAFTELLCATGASLIGTEFSDVVAEADRGDVVELIRRLVTSPDEQERPVELRVRTRHGERWFRVFATSESLARGRTPLLVVAAEDITEHKAAAERERLLNRRYHGLLDALPDPLFLLDATGSVQYANHAAGEVFGEFLFGDSWELGALGAKILDLAKPVGTAGRQLSVDTEVGFRSGRRRFDVSLVPEPDHDQTVLAVLRDRTQRHEVAAQLAHQGAHDPLTQLPNRTSLSVALRRRLDEFDVQRPTEVGVLVLALDRFQLVNESLGHRAGDDVLVEIARRLRAELGPDDLLARMDGDEFAVLVGGVADDNALLAMVARLQVSLSAPVTVDQREFTLSASVGVATTADPTLAAEELLRRADASMHRAKAAGPGRADRFDASLQAEVERRLEFHERLRLALSRRELRVYFQPEVELTTGRILGAEALLRWEHPRYGLLSLGQFSQVAEDTEMILDLGRWVLDQACAHALRWRAAFGDRFVLRVNMSARELRSPGLVNSVAHTLGRQGYPPDGLCIELTETALMGDAPASTAVLDELHALGVSLAIDDFGTGYSSLSYLKRFPVDVLKIDRQFVQGLPGGDDRAIVATVMALADALGLTVTAEGVERTDQRDALNALGCLRGQGYLYAPAMSSAAFDRIVEAGAPLPPRAEPTATWDG